MSHIFNILFKLYLYFKIVHDKKLKYSKMVHIKAKQIHYITIIYILEFKET